MGVFGGRLWQERTSQSPSSWPTVVAYALNVDLTEPGSLGASARVTFEDVADRSLHFLFNRSLTVRSARVAGTEVEVSHRRRLSSRYHSEGRLVRVQVAEPSPDGRVELDLEFDGKAAMGTRGSDWLGMLFVDEGGHA